MIYYDYENKPIMRYKRYYTTFTPFHPTDKVSKCEQYIDIVKETSKMLYGTSFNGRWKYDKQKNIWFHYVDYRWKEERGTFVKIENPSWDRND